MPNSNKIRVKTTLESICKGSATSSSDNNSKRKVLDKKPPRESTRAKSASTGVITPCNFAKTSIVRPKKTTKSEQSFPSNITKGKPVDYYCDKCGDVIDYNSGIRKKDNFEHKKSNKDVFTVKTDYGKVIKSSTLSKKSSKLEKPKKVGERIQISSRIIEKDQIPTCCRTVEENRDKTYVTKEKKNEFLTNRRQPVEQYYKNDNFRVISDSNQEIKDLKKASSLDTIKELPEISAIMDDLSKIETSSIFKLLSDEDNVTVEDPDDYDSIRKLKEFRDDNYFETHSVTSRLRSKGSVTSLPDHECVYRFYLNDRLFPVPLNAVNNNEIRCTECHLPLKFDERTTKDNGKNINGTIQAKVRLGGEYNAQDIIIMLPVNKKLIIRENRNVKKKIDEDVVYFGIIKLDSCGNSIFNKITPTDSLALKYQKGYREFQSRDDFEYDKVSECEVIVV